LTKEADKVRRRLPRTEREKLIVDEAIRFFAEVGFEGQTRALAARLGVTQPLLYRYFPDKDALIERVYEEVFLGGWDDDWSDLLADRSQPLAQRLARFYAAYAKANFNFERLRLFLFAGLRDDQIARRYLDLMAEHLYLPLVREIRAEAGLPAAAEVRAGEIECVAGLHGAIGYVALRHWVLMAPTADDFDGIVASLISNFLDGAPATFKALTQ
jgi:AcrR family transcriptional regulator